MGKINFNQQSVPPRIRAASLPTFVPSPQQAAVFLEVQLGTDNLLIEAVAGSGKTTTLAEVCKFIDGNAVFLAFNKKIATDIAAKLRSVGVEERTVKASTFHAAGFAAWRHEAPGVSVKNEKSEQLMCELGVPRHLWAFVAALASLAKQAVYGVAFRPEDRDDWLDLIDHHDVTDKLTAGTTTIDQQAAEGIDWTLRLLDESLRRAEQLIDFDDMIWVPLARRVKFAQYDWVLVDEAQDTNAARRLMAERMLRPGGRFIAVGDRHQAIYGFTGANADALDRVAATFGCKHMPLTTTYRCPKAVVRHAQRWVSHIEAAGSAPEGSVRTITRAEFDRDLEPSWLHSTDAILCRNTKPLVQLAFDLIRRKVPCHVEGREIGKGLLALTRRWRSAHTIGELESKLMEYLKHESARLHNKKAKLAVVEDKVETLLALMEQLTDRDPVYALERVIEDLFQDSDGQRRPSVTLSTVHKAKGREWDRVFLLGRDEFMPSKYATQPWQQEQERNLCYVAVTRARHELIEIRMLSDSNPEPKHLQYHREQGAEITQRGSLAVVDYRRHPLFDSFDDAAAAASDAEAGYDPFGLDHEWFDERREPARIEYLSTDEEDHSPFQRDYFEHARQLHAAKESGPLLDPIVKENLIELDTHTDRTTAPSLRSLTYHCPRQGRDISIGPEDFRLSIDYGENFFITIDKCFCGEDHTFKI